VRQAKLGAHKVQLKKESSYARFRKNQIVDYKNIKFMRCASFRNGKSHTVLIRIIKIHDAALKLSAVSAPGSEPAAGANAKGAAKVVFEGRSKTDLLRRRGAYTGNRRSIKLRLVGVSIDIVDGQDPILGEGELEANNPLECIARQRSSVGCCIAAIGVYSMNMDGSSEDVRCVDGRA